MSETHEAELDPIIAEVIVGPEEEEFILQPVVMCHEHSPIQELIHS